MDKPSMRSASLAARLTSATGVFDPPDELIACGRALRLSRLVKQGPLT